MKFTIRLWIATLTLLLMSSIGFAQEVSEISGTSDGTVISADTVTDIQELARFGRGVFDLVEWAPDDSVLAVAARTGLWLYDPNDMRASATPLLGHTDTINSVAFTMDSSQIAIADDAGQIIIWDVATREVVNSLNIETSISSMALSADGSLAAVSTSRAILLFDMVTGEELAELEDETIGAPAGSLQFLDEDSVLLTFTRSANVAVWDTTNNSLEQTIELEGSGTETHTLVDSTLVLLGTRDVVRVVDIETGDLLYQIEEGLRSTQSMDVSVAESAIAVGTITELIFFSLQDGAVLVTVDERFTRDLPFISDLAFNSEGTTLATLTADMAIDLWTASAVLATTPPEGQDSVSLFGLRENADALVATVNYHTNPVSALSLAPDNTTLLASDSATTLTAWSVADGSIISQQPEIVTGTQPLTNSVIYSPDGSFYVTRNFSRIYVYDAESHEQRYSATLRSTVFTIAITADSSLIIVGQGDGFLDFMSPESSDPLLQTQVGISWIASMQLSIDGTLLSLGSRDGTARILGIANE